MSSTIPTRTPPEPAASPGAVAAVVDHPLIYVTGNGGAGKTTVAAALGLVAARAGRRALVCELSGDHLPALFGHHAGKGERRLDDNLWTLRLDAEDALEKWLARQRSGAVAASVLRRSRTFSHFVAAAPGAQELVALGKLTDLADRAREHGRRYDADWTWRSSTVSGRTASATPGRRSWNGSRSARTPASCAPSSKHTGARARADQVRRLRKRTSAPLVTLPFVFATEIGRSELGGLADALAADAAVVRPLPGCAERVRPRRAAAAP